MPTDDLGTLVEILGKLQKPLSRVVARSLFIPSDSLVASFGKIHQTLSDALDRSRGRVPPTPSQVAFWRRETNKFLKKKFPNAPNQQGTPIL